MASNPVELVDKATSEYLVQMDWTTCLEICDILNRERVHARNVVRQIIKRLKEKSRVVLLALELSDSLVQNCECTHPYFGDRSYLTELNRIIMNKKSKEPVKDKALELTEVWGKAFQQRADIPGFFENYSYIKKTGYKFPPPRPDAPKINFNQKFSPTVPPQQQPTNIYSNPVHIQYPTYPPQVGAVYPPPSVPYYSPQQLQQPLPPPQQQQRPVQPTQPSTQSQNGKPVTQEYSSIKENVTVFTEMISFLNVETEDPSKNELLKELLENCKKSNTRIKEHLESGNIAEKDLGPLLSLNDEINRALTDYENALKKRQDFVSNGYKPISIPPKIQSHQPIQQPISMKHRELEEIDFFKAPDVPSLNPFLTQQQQPQNTLLQQQQQLSNPNFNSQYNPFLPPQQQQQQTPQGFIPNTAKSLPLNNNPYGNNGVNNTMIGSNGMLGGNNGMNNGGGVGNKTMDEFDLFISSRHNSPMSNNVTTTTNTNSTISQPPPFNSFNQQQQQQQQLQLQKPTAPNFNFNTTPSNNNINSNNIGSNGTNPFQQQQQQPQQPLNFNNTNSINNRNSMVLSNGMGSGNFPNYGALDPFTGNQYQPQPYQPNPNSFVQQQQSPQQQQQFSNPSFQFNNNLQQPNNMYPTQFSNGNPF